jgi:hypothetical protein
MKYAVVLFVISIVASVFILNPRVKKLSMDLLLNTSKEVLSQMEVDLAGTSYKIVKVQNVKGLAVELYKLDEGVLTFLDSKQMTDKKDAFYKFDDEKHNLFLKDVNGDGVADIILPSIDKNMKARLNIYSIDTVNEVLQKQTTH